MPYFKMKSSLSGLHIEVSTRFVGVYVSKFVWYSGVLWITWQLKSDKILRSTSLSVSLYGNSLLYGAISKLVGFSSLKQLNGADCLAVVQ